MKQSMTLLQGGAQSQYALITPIIESKKLRIVGEDRLHEILNSNGVSEAITKIGKTDIGLQLTQDCQQTVSARDLELFSWRFLANELYTMYGDYPAKAQLLIDYYLSKYDVLNLKSVIRKIFCNVLEPAAGMPLGSISRGGRLPDLLECKSQQEISRLLHSLSMVNYAEIIEGTKERMDLEIALEREYYARLIKMAQKIRDDRVSDFIGLLIDLTNILLILRCVSRGRRVKREALLNEGYALTSRHLDECSACNALDAFLAMLGKTAYFRLGARLSEAYLSSRDDLSLENVVNQHANRAAKEMFLGSVFTPGYILDYVLLRENEVRLVTTALKMVEEQIPYDAFAKHFAGGNV